MRRAVFWGSVNYNIMSRRFSLYPARPRGMRPRRNGIRRSHDAGSACSNRTTYMVMWPTHGVYQHSIRSIPKTWILPPLTKLAAAALGAPVSIPGQALGLCITSFRGHLLRALPQKRAQHPWHRRSVSALPSIEEKAEMRPAPRTLVDSRPSARRRRSSHGRLRRQLTRLRVCPRIARTCAHWRSECVGGPEFFKDEPLDGRLVGDPPATSRPDGCYMHTALIARD